MTEDHRVTSYSEQQRIEKLGEPLKDEETRLCGLNLARMLRDKFLKQQDNCFSSEPYTSQVVHIDQAARAFALMASDGFWDVNGVKKASQLVLQERFSADSENLAKKIANFLLGEARKLHTKDNTTILRNKITPIDTPSLPNISDAKELRPAISTMREPNQHSIFNVMNHISYIHAVVIKNYMVPLDPQKINHSSESDPANTCFDAFT